MNNKLMKVILIFLLVLLTAGCMNTQRLPVVAQPQIEKSAIDLQADNKAFIENWLSVMTLEDKVGQMVVGFFRGPTLSSEMKERIARYRLGGVILYDSTGNIQDVQQVATLNESLQRYAKVAGVPPMFIAIDQEGGWVTRLQKGVTVFPGNMAIGATRKADYAFQAANITSRELKILGINMNFAPVLDVNSNPENPVIGVRSFGSNPQEVARLGSAMIPACKQNQVICVVKHFPGHGDTSMDSHMIMPRIAHSRERLNAVELVPFSKSIETGVSAIMTAHVSVESITGSELPMTLSAKGIGLLRNEMGFQGIIVSDSLTMGAIMSGWSIGEASVKAVEAGVDLLVFGADRGHVPSEQEEAIQAIISAVKKGQISVARIDESVRRILTVKKEYGLMNNALPQLERLSELGSKANWAVADTIASESLTWVRHVKVSGLLDLGSTLILWPETEAEASLQLSALLPKNQIENISMSERMEPGNPLTQKLKQATRVIIASYDLQRNLEWGKVILRLHEIIDPEKITVVAMRSPYDIQQLPGVVNYLVVYDDGPASIRALADFIMGKTTPVGVLPVTVLSN